MKVEKLVASMDRLELKYRIPEACQPFLKPDGRRPFKLKHAVQQASIAGEPSETIRAAFDRYDALGYLMEKGVFERSGEPPLVIEFGAGKAYLSSMISDCTDAKSFVLVDNQAFKMKVCVGTRRLHSNRRTNASGGGAHNEE